MTEKQEVLNRVEKCLKYDMLSDEAIVKINQIIIEDLEESKLKLNPDDMPREVDPDCESGVCGAR
jgi:ATP-dependent Clp protease ATP-binding subunit ClpA